MAATVPVRVRRGTGLYYLWDGVHAMTELGGGIGTILTGPLSFPTVTLTNTEFDDLQAYLEGRDIFFAQQIADAVNNP